MIHVEAVHSSLEDHFLEVWPRHLNAHESWAPGRTQQYERSIRLHCEAVARELRARGRAGEGATVKVEEFIHLFLTQGQLDYLYAAEPRNRPHITLDTLSLPSDYMRATLEDPLNMSPCQFFGRPANNTPASIHELVNYKDRSGRWGVLWPELRRAMDRYIPQDVWPCGVPYSAYGMVHPYA